MSQSVAGRIFPCGKFTSKQLDVVSDGPAMFSCNAARPLKNKLQLQFCSITAYPEIFQWRGGGWANVVSGKQRCCGIRGWRHSETASL